jgi:protein transport protein SEC24
MFYSLHNMPPEVSSFTIRKCGISLHHSQAGTVGEQGVILPTPLPLTSERLERHGLYLIEDGQTIFLWVGRDAVPRLVMDVFNLPNYEALRGSKVGI